MVFKTLFQLVRPGTIIEIIALLMPLLNRLLNGGLTPVGQFLVNVGGWLKTIDANDVGMDDDAGNAMVRVGQAILDSAAPEEPSVPGATPRPMFDRWVEEAGVAARGADGEVDTQKASEELEKRVRNYAKERGLSTNETQALMSMYHQAVTRMVSGR